MSQRHSPAGFVLVARDGPGPLEGARPGGAAPVEGSDR